MFDWRVFAHWTALAIGALAGGFVSAWAVSCVVASFVSGSWHVIVTADMIHDPLVWVAIPASLPGIIVGLALAETFNKRW
jgi:hypothetical protein